MLTFMPMKHKYPRLLLNFFLLLLVSCLFTACQKELLPKQSGAKGVDTTGTGTGTGTDTTVTPVAEATPSFYSPAGVAVDAAGNIYVADYGNNLIREISPTGMVSTLAGSGVQGRVDNTGTVASFNQPTGIAVDAAGNVYIGDAGNDRLRKITPGGVVTTLAGSDSTGYTDGPGITAAFFNPEGNTLDGTGNVFVADAGNNLIRKVTPDGTVSTFASSGVVIGDAGAFSNPTGIAIDASGNLYVANALKNNILKINLAGAISTLAGTGAIGFQDGPGTTATFYFPNSVVVDAMNNIYVSDGVNNLVRKITPDGTVSTLAGSGKAGADDGTGATAAFNGPAGLAVDVAGNIYVADSNNNLIRKITQGGVVTTVAGSGRSGSRNGQAVVRRNPKVIKAASLPKLQVFYKKK
jgi:sugar lactone lactonase YvrE